MEGKVQLRPLIQSAHGGHTGASQKAASANVSICTLRLVAREKL